MKKIVLFAVLFVLAGCSEMMTTRDALTSTGDSVSSSVKATTNTTKSSTNSVNNNWEYDE